MTDTSFAERLGAHRVVAGAIQQSLADRASIHVTQVHRYEAGSSSQLWFPPNRGGFGYAASPAGTAVLVS